MKTNELESYCQKEGCDRIAVATAKFVVTTSSMFRRNDESTRFISLCKQHALFLQRNEHKFDYYSLMDWLNYPDNTPWWRKIGWW